MEVFKEAKRTKDLKKCDAVILKNNQYPKIRKPLKGIRNYLPFVIFSPPHSFKKEYVGTDFQYANDEFHSVDLTDRHLYLVLGFICTGFAILRFLIHVFSKNGGRFDSLVFLSIIGAFCFLCYFTLPRHVVVFDRLNGLITYPGFMWAKPIQVPFDQIAVSKVISGEFIAYSIYHPSGYTRMSLCESLNEWSLYVWYMDKNRPLPPGDAFDAYRERDFDRRKAAGFPPPLYQSMIPTPEHTASQQAERAKYWLEISQGVRS